MVSLLFSPAVTIVAAGRSPRREAFHVCHSHLTSGRFRTHDACATFINLEDVLWHMLSPTRLSTQMMSQIYIGSQRIYG